MTRVLEPSSSAFGTLTSFTNLEDRSFSSHQENLTRKVSDRTAVFVAGMVMVHTLNDALGYDGYLTNETINGLIAEQQNGSTIVLEHRYYGLSNPFNNLSETSLRFHTIQQAIDDLEYFAKNVDLPMPDGDDLAPGKAPWVLIGGSYSGERHDRLAKSHFLIVVSRCPDRLDNDQVRLIYQLEIELFPH